MSKLKFSSVLLILFFPLFTYATTQRTNVFCAANSTGIALASIGIEYHVTSGQPWGGVSNTRTSNCITIYAGRDGSNSNVTWIKNNLENQVSGQVTWTSSMVTGGYGGIDSLPGNLNFAVKGTLLITQVNSSTGKNTVYSCPGVIIAQGYVEKKATNNWWVVNNSTVYNNSVQCLDPNTNQYVFFRVSVNSENSMKFVQVQS